MRRILTSTTTIVLLIAIFTPEAAAQAKKRPAAPTGGVVLQTPNPRTPLEHNNRGVELGSKGLWPDAIREHELALIGDPNNKTFRTNLSAAQLRYGDVLMRKGDFYNAMKQYRGALYVDPNNMPAEDHLDECLKHVKKDPYDVSVRLRLAEDAEISGDFETAIVEYRRAVKIADDGPTHARLGRALIKAQKTVDGYAALRTAVSKNWDGKDKIELAACHRQLGDILKEYAFVARKMGKGSIGMTRLYNAGTCYRRAVTINEADADAKRSLVEVAREAVAIQPSFDNYMMLGGAYLLLDDFEHAKIAYEQCYKLEPRHSALAGARIAYHQRVARSPMASPALVNESISKVKKFLELDPENARWWYILGRLHEHMRNNDEALQYYRKAKQINAYIDPDLKLAFGRLGARDEAASIGGDEIATASGAASGGRSAAGQESSAASSSAAGEPAQAAASAPPARKIKNYSPVEQALEAGDLDAAMRLLSEMLESDAADGRAWYLKGNVHAKRNELADAAASFRQASLFKEPDADAAWRQVSTLRVQPNLKKADEYSKSGNSVKAAEELREAIIIAPNLPILHSRLAEVLRQLGDTQEAERELKKAKELETAQK